MHALPEVDASFGLEVAGRFLEARSEPGNEKVVAAYQCLEDESDRLFAALTQDGRTVEFGSYSRSARAPTTQIAR